MSYTNIFGGNPVEPAQVSYELLHLTGDVHLSWPAAYLAVSSSVVALITEVTQTGVYNIFMPDSTAVSPGSSAIFRNTGTFSFSVKSLNGNAIATIAPGIAYFIYLTDNSTPDGVWSYVQFGAGSSSADAAALAGLGLIAITTKLNTNFPVQLLTSNYVATDTDRASLFVWEGGTGTFTLPSPSALNVGNGFYTAISNQSQLLGLLTVLPNGGTIDFDTQVILAPNQSAYFITDGVNWFTLIGGGGGSNQPVSVNSQDVSGGTNVTLTVEEAASLIQRYTGTLTANINVIAPLLPAQYYVYNQTSGAFNLSFTVASGGANVYLVPQGTRAQFFCDGVNIFNVPSYIQFSPGTVSQPTITFSGDTNTGIYHPGSNNVAVTLGGTQTVNITLPQSQFINQVAASSGTNTTPSYAYISDGTSGMYQPSVGQVGFAAGGTTSAVLTVSYAQFFDPVFGVVGSSGSPSFSFSGDASTGIFHPATSSVGVTCAGSVVATFNPSGAQFVGQIDASSGTAAAPGYAFIADGASGMYQPSVGQVGIASAGASSVVFSSTSAQFSQPILGIIGSAGAPSFSFSGDASTGWYHPSPSQMGASLGSTPVLLMTGTNSQFYTQIVVPVGSAPAPSLIFSTALTSGIFHDSTGVCIGNTSQKTLSSNATGDTLSLYPWGGGAGQTGQAQFLELGANGTNYVSLQAPDALAANVSFTLPNTLPASTQAIVCDTSGTLSYSGVPLLLSANATYTPLTIGTFTNGSPLSIQLTPTAGLLSLLTSAGTGSVWISGSCAITVPTLLANETVLVQLYTDQVSAQGINTLIFSIGGTQGAGFNGGLNLPDISNPLNTQLFLQFSTTDTSVYSLQSLGYLINFTYFP